MPLTEDKRSQLDNIVEQMMGNQETDDDIQWVVNDFKAKYSGVEPSVSAPEAPRQEIIGQPIQGQGPIDVLGEQLANVPKSAYELGRGVVGGVKAFIPGTEEAATMGKTIAGAAESLIPGTQGHEQYAEGVAKYFVNRFGGVENLAKTAKEDPVGFVADIASVLSGVGAVFRGLGGAGKVGAIGKAMAETGRVAEPIGIAAKGAEKVSQLGKRATTAILGKTTGMGGEVAQEMARGTRPIGRIGRGIEGEGIVQEARTGLDAIKDQRASEYLKKLEKVKQADVELNIAPVQQKLEQVMKDYRIKGKPEDVFANQLDFSRSTIDRNAIPDVEKIIKDVADWGSQPGDLTPIGLDTLKRRLDDFYSPSKNSRAVVSQLRNEVKDILVKNVPEYESMVKDYAKMSDLSTQIEKALSLGDRASIDTTLRKLITGIKEDSGFRRQLMDDLKDYSGKDIQGMISEYVAKPLVSRSISSGITAVGAGLGSYFSLKFLPLFAAASPRLVSEFLNAMGKGEKIAKAVAKTAPSPGIRLGAFQAGRVGLMPEMEQ